MNENDPIADIYNFDQITADTTREIDRRESVVRLNEALLRAGNCQPLTPDLLSRVVVGGVHSLGVHVGHNPVAANISSAYEQFTGPAGVDIESRIVVISTNSEQPSPFGMPLIAMGGMIVGAEHQHGQENPDITYLLAAVGKDQKILSPANIRYGAVQKADGLVVFFKFLPFSEVKDGEGSPQIRAAKEAGLGQDNKDLYVALELTPFEEQTLIIEFNKATAALNEQADERPAVVSLDTPESHSTLLLEQGLIRGPAQRFIRLDLSGRDEHDHGFGRYPEED